VETVQVPLVNTGTPLPAPTTVRQSQQAGVRDIRETAIDTGTFRNELDSRIRPEGLKFSGHAVKRLEMRGISFTPDGLQRIEQAVDRVAAKGSRDALVVAGKISLVVSVNNRTVVTVMGLDNMQESVVTNIDSAVFA